MGDFQVPIALGTQTGGSTIRPASYNGVFALKPTWNAISREGLKMCRSIEDLEETETEEQIRLHVTLSDSWHVVLPIWSFWPRPSD